MTITCVSDSFNTRRKVTDDDYLYMMKVSERNICQSFESCRQTFEAKGYKLTFVYALLIGTRTPQITPVCSEA